MDKKIDFLKNTIVGLVAEKALVIDENTLLRDIGIESLHFATLILKIEEEFKFEFDFDASDISNYETIEDVVSYITIKTT